jgi:hypothetical protein
MPVDGRSRSGDAVAVAADLAVLGRQADDQPHQALDDPTPRQAYLDT